MKILILCLLVVIGSCTYNATIAKKLAIASAAAYASDAEILNWGCKVCAGFPLTKVNIISYLDRAIHEQYLRYSWLYRIFSKLKCNYCGF